MSCVREGRRAGLLYDTASQQRDPIPGGSRPSLQLEVVQYRLQNEIGGWKTRARTAGFPWLAGVKPWLEALEVVGRLFNCKTVRDCPGAGRCCCQESWNFQPAQRGPPGNSASVPWLGASALSSRSPSEIVCA